MLAHRTRRAAALLASLAVLTGCDSNPSPAPLPSESPTPSSSSPSPTATPPTLPAAAKGTSEAAAKVFARHYVDTLNFATATGITDEARTLSGKDCGSCEAMISKIEDVYSNGGYFRGDGWSVTDLKYQPFQPRKRPVLSVAIHLTPQKMLEQAGGEVQEFKGGPNTLTLRLRFEDTGWTVQRLDRLS